MNDTGGLPSSEVVQAVLGRIAPGAVVLEVGSLPGSYSNFTHLVNARSVDGSLFRVVLRRYAEFGDYDRGEKARQEFECFALLRRHGVPAPEPLFLDETSTILGTPGIVTSYVSGEQVAAPADAARWARSLARVLAKIHAISCGNEAGRFLLDGHSEALWFVGSGVVPPFMSAHPDGAVVWQVVQEGLSQRQPVSPVLVHLDYWAGNVLWDEREISAVVDWEEAACGDPGIDVAYCRMDMVLSGLEAWADVFLAAYEAERGERVANLGFWELAAAARPMFSPEGWISESPARERFRQFVADARRRAVD